MTAQIMDSPKKMRGGLQLRKARGFTLVEIAIVIVILGFLLAMLIGIASSLIGQQRREATRQRLAGVETALALFAAQYKRLPCPADGRVAGVNAVAGLEQRNAGVCNVGVVAGSQTHGVVPWRALGMSEQDVTDGWGVRMTYRVHVSLVNEPAMNFTFCDPGGSEAVAPAFATPGGWCNSACTTATFPASCTPPGLVIPAKGFEVRNLAGSPVMVPASGTGAAYVVISHGENTFGGYSNQGVLQAAAGAGAGTEETARNAANVAITYFVDDFAVYTAGTGHFDDFLLRPAILAVASRAQMGPRAH